MIKTTNSTPTAQAPAVSLPLRPARSPWLIAAAATAALGASAIFNHRRAAQAEAATPPAGTFVEVDGVKLHYVERGTGPAVVLLHGNAVLLQDFEASGLLDLAAVGHRVIAFDRPGFGYSDRPRSTLWSPAAQARLIARALEKLAIEPAVIVAHSWGTMIALNLALDHRDRVAGLVLLSGYYYGTMRPDVVPALLPAIPLAGDVMAHTVTPLLTALTGPAGVKASFAPAPVPDKFAQVPVALTLRPSQLRAAAADTAMMVPAATALSRRYGEIGVPVIIMAGGGDLIAHVGKHSERLHRDIAHSDLRIVPDQGHMFHYAVPEQVVAAIGEVVAT